jgi:hypothetical protein
MWMGIAILLFLFLPRLGHLRISPETREIEFRDSLTAALLHPWSGRVRKSTILTPGSVVLVGSWPTENAGPSESGIKVVPSGKDMILLTSVYHMNDHLALEVKEALSQLEGVEVRPIKIGPDYQVTEWVPTGSANPWPTFALMAKFGLIGCGWIAAMLGLTTRNLLLLGGVSSIVYAACCALAFAKTGPADPDDRKFSAVSLAFGVLQFALLYTMITLVGTTIGSRPQR